MHEKCLADDRIDLFTLRVGELVDDGERLTGMRRGGGSLLLGYLEVQVFPST